jgi:hypothetical protein
MSPKEIEMDSRDVYLQRKFPKFEYTQTGQGPYQLILVSDLAKLAEKVMMARKYFTNRSPRFAECDEIGIDAKRAYFGGKGGRELPQQQPISLGNGYTASLATRSFGDYQGRIIFRKE